MAKKIEKAVDVKVIDKTNQSWYSKAGSNKVTFCNSIDDIIEGKGETLEIREKIISTRTVVKDGKLAQHQSLILFILNDGKFAIVRKRDELK